MRLTPESIDGSVGEGGGQVLRSSLALSAITGRPFEIKKIRGRRSRPGLLRQHLTAVRAAAEICQAQVEGDELHSAALSFRPGKVRHGEFRFSVGTAGSATLVLQTVLWPLLATPGRSTLVLEGGTHNPAAPPFHYLDEVLFPLLGRMGAKVEARLERAGFFPAGGGRFVVELEGGHAWKGLELLEPGAVKGRFARALVSNLPANIGHQELYEVASQLGWSAEQLRCEELKGPGPGNVLMLRVDYERTSVMSCAFGERGKARQEVAMEAIAKCRGQIASECPVDEHLADQLLIPGALAGELRYLTSSPTLHTRTNAEIVQRFLPVSIQMREGPRERTTIEVRQRPG